MSVTMVMLVRDDANVFYCLILLCTVWSFRPLLLTKGTDPFVKVSQNLVQIRFGIITSIKNRFVHVFLFHLKIGLLNFSDNANIYIDFHLTSLLHSNN